MSTTRARKKKTSENPAAKLLEAVKFVKLAQMKNGPVEYTHCMICNNWIVAKNSVLTIGSPIEENINCFPNTYMLEEALKKVTDEISITELSPNSLSIVSGLFRGVVPCNRIENFDSPDNVCGNLNLNLKEHFKLLIKIIATSEENPVLNSLYINGPTCVATDFYTIIETFNGIYNLPKVQIPRIAIAAVIRTKKELVKFGYSENSFTFWFGDDSFIRTRIYKTNYPQYEQVFEPFCSKPLLSIPENFFEGIKSIEVFSDDGIVIFKNGHIYSSKKIESERSAFTIENLADEMLFKGKKLMLMKDYFDKICFSFEPHSAYFQGEWARALTMGATIETIETNENVDNAPF